MAGEWGYDLVRLDAGALYDKFVGESEKRLRKALELAQKLSPVVLWIDEIEKAFASAGASGDADAGLSQRLLATLLTWMQDRESGVFLAATSNNITVLPPEMVRKGRFDEIFFVDLPNTQIRAALFALHLKKRGRDPGTFDAGQLGRASEGFSGAEIEQAIVSGLYTAFSQKQQLVDGDSAGRDQVHTAVERDSRRGNQLDSRVGEESRGTCRLNPVRLRAWREMARRGGAPGRFFGGSHYFFCSRENAKSKTMSPTGTRSERSWALLSRSNHITPAVSCPEGIEVGFRAMDCTSMDSLRSNAT